jgi:putative ABC transport system substrate-binding protein
VTIVRHPSAHRANVALLSLLSTHLILGITSVLLFAISSSADAQSTGKVFRVGYLSSGTASPNTDPGFSDFRTRLQALGYVEGQNLHIELRYAELDQTRLQGYAAELAELKVDVLVTSPDEPVVRAAQTATRSVPIVLAGSVADPTAPTFWGEKERAPLVASLARPAGNITGLTNLDAELHPKRLELLKESFPYTAKVALLWPRAQQQNQTLKDIEAVKQALGIEIQSLAAGTLDDLESALVQVSRQKPDALLIARSQVLLKNRDRVIAFTIKRKTPTIFAGSENVAAGGLMSYGADIRDLYSRAAVFVHKILTESVPVSSRSSARLSLSS